MSDISKLIFHSTTTRLLSDGPQREKIRRVELNLEQSLTKICHRNVFQNIRNQKKPIAPRYVELSQTSCTTL